MEENNESVTVEDHEEVFKAFVSVSPSYLELYEESSITDIKLIIGDRSFLCHRVILAAHSEYFRTMFTSDFKEKDKAEINLIEIDCSIASIVIKYIYGYVLKLTLMKLSQVQAVYALALQWAIKELQEQCHCYFITILNARNCCQLATFADYHAPDLHDEILAYITDNFFRCIKTKSLQDLSYNLLVKLIQCDYLNIINEDQILESLNIWIDSDTSSRKKLIVSLLCHLRLAYISPESLISIDERYMNEIENSLEYLNAIRRVQNYRQNPENYFDKSTKPRMYYENIDFVGVTLVHAASMKADCYNLHGIINCNCYPLHRFDFSTSDKVKDFTLFERVRLTYAAVCVGHKIVVFGGMNAEKEVLNSVIAFDFRNAEWTVPVWGFDLPQPLAYLAACIYNDEIYIMGGLNEDGQCSNKVWKLCRQSKTWEAVVSLNTPRKCCQAVVVDNYIYIGGGLDDNEELITTFERYDPIHNTWNFVYDLTASNLSMRLLYGRRKLLVYCTQIFHECYMQSLDGKWYKTSDYKISQFSREINGKDYITDGYIAIDQETIEYGFLIPSCKWRRNIKIFDAIPIKIPRKLGGRRR